MRTTAYVPRSACTAAQEPRFGVPSSTTRVTCRVSGRWSAARRDQPPHAVRHDGDAFHRRHALGERAPELGDPEPPVVVVKLGGEAARA